MSDLKKNLTGKEFCFNCDNKEYFYSHDEDYREQFERIYDRIEKMCLATDITFKLAIKEAPSHKEYSDRCEKGIELSKKNTKIFVPNVIIRF